MHSIVIVWVLYIIPFLHIWPDIGNIQSTDITERRVYHRIHVILIRVYGEGLEFRVWVRGSSIVFE